MISERKKEVLRQLMIIKNIDYVKISSIIDSIDSEEKYIMLVKKYRV